MWLGFTARGLCLRPHAAGEQWPLCMSFWGTSLTMRGRAWWYSGMLWTLVGRQQAGLRGLEKEGAWFSRPLGDLCLLPACKEGHTAWQTTRKEATAAERQGLLSVQAGQYYGNLSVNLSLSQPQDRVWDVLGGTTVKEWGSDTGRGDGQRGMH